MSKVDDTGESIEKVFDRKRDMPKQIPELKTGMVVKTYVPKQDVDCTCKTGIVVDNRIIYTTGGWNYITDFDEYGNRINIEGIGILSVYNTIDLDCCDEDHCIWSKED